MGKWADWTEEEFSQLPTAMLVTSASWPELGPRSGSPQAGQDELNRFITFVQAIVEHEALRMGVPIPVTASSLSEAHMALTSHPAWTQHYRCSPNHRLGAGSLCLYTH